jgi:phosphatidylglycerophosphate synthase
MHGGPQGAGERADEQDRREGQGWNRHERDAGALIVLDRRARAIVARPLERAARRLAGAGVSAGTVTAVGFALGVGACVAAATELWLVALGLWLANRLADGLDGPIARLRGASAAGGFADIMVDFTVYGGFVLAVAIARPEARLACVALFFAYYVSGVAFLAWSATAEQLRRDRPDERSLHFVGGLAEGAETIAAYALFCLLPERAELIAWVFAALVAVTAIQRVAFVHGALSHSSGPGG